MRQAQKWLCMPDCFLQGSCTSVSDDSVNETMCKNGVLIQPAFVAHMPIIPEGFSGPCASLTP